MPSPNESISASTRGLRDDLRYIAVEGVIGAGKTTLALLLAERFDARVVLEEFEENPFLDRFYEDRSRWAFQTQLSFLASRFRQQKELASGHLFHSLVVSDYTFDKDRIFAGINLSDDELHLYETLYGLMEPVTPVPDLVVYLRADVPRLMGNIQRRGRPYEQNMDPGYLGTLCDAYEMYFAQYRKGRLLVLDMADVDFVQNKEEFETVVSLINRPEHPGTAHYGAASSRPMPF